MKSSTINILIASDINYAPYYGVMLTSLFENNRESSFDVFLITDETWTEKETKKFSGLCENHRSRFIVNAINVERMDSFPKSAHINRATYFNLSAANILPSSVHKIIYMDGDMIANGDIRPIWNVDIEEHACAMVEDCSTYDQSIYDRLGYCKNYGFYNNGVTVYNMDFLRKMNFSEKALRFIAENSEKALWMDQDAINVLLAEKTLSLPMTCNFQTLFLLNHHWKNYNDEFRAKVLDASMRPIVIHYAGRIKPWNWRYYGLPYQQEWNHYYDISSWKCARVYKPYDKYIKHLIKRILKGRDYLTMCQKEYIPEAHIL